MLTVFFNGSGPIVVNFLPSKLKFNGQYFLDILEEIRMNVYSKGHAQRTARKILHFENCPSNHSQKVKDYIEATIQILNPNRKKLELFHN